MFILIIFTTFAWSGVSCNETTTYSTAAATATNSTELDDLFKAKYMSGAGYKKWQKLHDAQPMDLNSLCTKFALMLSKDETVSIKAEGKASYRDKYWLLGNDKDPVEVDTLTCLIKFLDKKAKVSTRMKYYLAEGDEPDSAFRFSLLQTTMVLTRKAKDIWTPQEETF